LENELLRKTEFGSLDVEGRGMLRNGKIYGLYSSSNNVETYSMIQEERFNILERSSTGHCGKEKSYENVSDSEWLPR
jgi:hypothetical protein